jgi:hypothetical protein
MVFSEFFTIIKESINGHLPVDNSMLHPCYTVDNTSSSGTPLELSQGYSIRQEKERVT